MNPIIKDFHSGVYTQAINSGHDTETAERIAALAVLSRVEKSAAGFAIAQTEDFEAVQLHTFELKNIRVDQSRGGGVIVDAVLVSPEEDVAGQSFDASALKEYEEYINTVGIFGYDDDNHREFRMARTRDPSNSVTEWVKARVEAGRLWISAKLKQGYEHLAEKFKYVSAEYLITAGKRRQSADGKTKVYGGEVPSFIFTNQPKQTLNRVVAIRSL